MIEPIKLINYIPEKLPHINVSKIPSTYEHSFKYPASETLKAYAGINSADSYTKFAYFFKSRLNNYETKIPLKLYKILKKMDNFENISFTKIVTDYYSKLNECKTFKEVSSLYPDIILPQKSRKQIINDEIKCCISSKICDNVKKLKPKEQKLYLQKFFDNLMAKPLKKSKIYSYLNQITDEISKEITDGKFNGYFEPLNKVYGQGRHVSTTKELLNTDYKNSILEILRRNYINLENIQEITIKNFDGDEINAHNIIRSGYKFSTLDSHFRTFIKALDV